MIDPASVDVSQFLHRWYGPPDLAPVKPADTVGWPLELVEWQLLSSRWSATRQEVVRVLPAAAVERHQGKFIFMEDGSGDWRWAVDPDAGADPVVFEAGLYASWQPTDERLRECLLHAALVNAAYTGSVFRSCEQVSETDLAYVLAPLRQVAFGGWQWPQFGKGRVFVGEHVVVTVDPAMELSDSRTARPGFFDVTVGALTRESVAYLDELDAVRWWRRP